MSRFETLDVGQLADHWIELLIAADEVEFGDSSFDQTDSQNEQMTGYSIECSTGHWIECLLDSAVDEADVQDNRYVVGWVLDRLIDCSADCLIGFCDCSICHEAVEQSEQVVDDHLVHCLIDRLDDLLEQTRLSVSEDVCDAV